MTQSFHHVLKSVLILDTIISPRIEVISDPRYSPSNNYWSEFKSLTESLQHSLKSFQILDTVPPTRIEVSSNLWRSLSNTYWSQFKSLTHFLQQVLKSVNIRLILHSNQFSYFDTLKLLNSQITFTTPHTPVLLKNFSHDVHCSSSTTKMVEA